MDTQSWLAISGRVKFVAAVRGLVEAQRDLGRPCTALIEVLGT